MGSTVRSKLENSNWGWHDGRVDGVGGQWALVGNQLSVKYAGEPQLVVRGWEWVGETKKDLTTT